MLRSIAIFVAGGLLGTLIGIAVGIFVYPYLFLADIVAAEQGEPRPAQGRRDWQLHPRHPSDPLHNGSDGVTVYHDLVHLEEDFAVGPGPKFHVYLVSAPRSPRRRRSGPAGSSTSAGCAPSRAARTT
jgi:hypothetical protein